MKQTTINTTENSINCDSQNCFFKKTPIQFNLTQCQTETNDAQPHESDYRANDAL